MNLNNFENNISQKIDYRGQNYYLAGYVEKVIETEQGHYTATVIGSRHYTVKVKVDHVGNILYSDCNCPYDFGDICKHEVAVFYELRDENFAEVAEEPALAELLQGLTKQELIELLVNYATKNSELAMELRLIHAPKEDEIAASRNLIKEYIDAATINGFVPWNKARDAVEGAELVLDKMQTSIDNQETKTAVLLGELILSEIIDLIQFCDDSDGSTGSVIDQAFEKLDNAIVDSVNHLTKPEKLEIVQFLVEAAKHERYEGWPEWRFALLQNCIPFCQVEECKKILEDELTTMLFEIKDDSWSSSYNHEKIKLIQFELIKQFDSQDTKQLFLERNIDSPGIREYAILENVEQDNYEKVIELCIEAEKKDQEYRGRVSKWQNYRYQAYEQLNDEPNQKSLGMSLLLAGDYDYFPKLKQLYQENEWPDVLEYITDHLPTSGYKNQVYLRILKEENLTDKILAYCQNNLSAIEELHPYLLKEYPEQVEEIFIQHILTMAKKATNRKRYREVCWVIKQFKKVSVQDSAEEIIKELEQKNRRRPAFLDELSKI